MTKGGSRSTALLAGDRATAPDVDTLVALVAPHDRPGLVSRASARVYRDTFARWQAWAAAAGIDPLELTFRTVGEYLAARDGTKATKQRELAALRTLAKLLKVLDYANPARAAAYESLKLLQVRATGETRTSERPRRALTWQDIDLEAGVIYVAHGKGDKVRDVALYGQAAADALKIWREAQPEGYIHVFVGFGGRGVALSRGTSP